MIAHRTNRTAHKVIRDYEPESIMDLDGSDLFAFDIVYEKWLTDLQRKGGSLNSKVNQALHNPDTQELIDFIEGLSNG